LQNDQSFQRTAVPELNRHGCSVILIGIFAVH
jgi:hypothetical protein